jgi:hypothetical protein
MIFDELMHKLENAKRIFADEIKLFNYQQNIGEREKSEPRRHAKKREGKKVRI